MKVEDITPRVPHWALYGLAGVTWSAVGLMLLRWTWVWLSPLGLGQSWIPFAAGLSLGAATAPFFAMMARANRLRIESLAPKVCLFAFQRWTSYPLVLLMITLGLTLRHSPLPRSWLAALYQGIGTGLLVASLVYFRALARRAGPNRPEATPAMNRSSMKFPPEVQTK